MRSLIPLRRDCQSPAASFLKTAATRQLSRHYYHARGNKIDMAQTLQPAG